MNIANLITILRLFLVPVFIYSLKTAPETNLPLVIFTISVITDILDGFLARMLKMQTSLGGTLDPIADKVLVISAFYVLCAMHRIPMWLFLLVIGKEVILISGIVFIFTITHKYRISVKFLGKFNTVMQMLTLYVTLLGMSAFPGIPGPLMNILFIVTGLSTLVTTIDYYLKGTKQLAS